MLGLISKRFLTLLQLTRMALVFTAISNSVCEVLLDTRGHIGTDRSIWQRLVATVCVSTGLYGFGMSLNDIIDHRRDRLLASDRPLPSGRIGVPAAHVVCAMFGALAIAGGFYVAGHQPELQLNFEARPTSFLLLIWTATLIVFYDTAGKYLVAPGLISLGLIRFFHSVIPAPTLPLLWHPLLLLNHVTILSAVAYRWEHKRPPMTKVHWWAVLGGLAVVDAMCIGLVYWRRQTLGITPGLLVPLAAVIAFILFAWGIRRRYAADIRGSERRAGQMVMLYGLLWLIIYDASFVIGYVGWMPALLLLCLLPMAYLSVKAMRGWSRVVSLSQTPEFQRAR